MSRCGRGAPVPSTTVAPLMTWSSTAAPSSDRLAETGRPVHRVRVDFGSRAPHQPDLEGSLFGHLMQPEESWSAPACSQRLHWVSTSSGSPQINSSSSMRSSTNSALYSGSVSGQDGQPRAREASAAEDEGGR